MTATTTRSTSMRFGAEQIWDVLADFGGIATWAGFVEHSSMLQAGPVEVGAARRIQMGSMVVLERIVDVDALTTLEYEIEGLPKAVSLVRNRWTLAPASGGTEVSIATTVRIGARPPQRLAERVLGRVLASRSDAMLAGLTAHLERQHV